jgi:hypothetical protein
MRHLSLQCIPYENIISLSNLLYGGSNNHLLQFAPGPDFDPSRKQKAAIKHQGLIVLPTSIVLHFQLRKQLEEPGYAFFSDRSFL